MKTGKAPGPDGFTLSYYKMFAALLAPRFVSAFNSLRDGFNIPEVGLLAHVAVLPKEGKDSAQCASYRPISLLNVDLKFFTTILANKLLPHIPSIVHMAQLVFVPCREVQDNTQRGLERDSFRTIFSFALNALLHGCGEGI